MTRKYNKSKQVKHLTAGAVKGFSELFLVNKYDGSFAIPDIHMEWWDLCTSLYPRVAIAAPRDHAKSTAVTFAYTLAEVCFRHSRYVIIIGCTEDDAIDFLTEIADTIRDNQDLREMFNIKRFLSEGKTNIVVEFEDGGKFRIRARGAGQKIRGKKWDGTRPDLILVDDLEDDESVESVDRRRKLSGWFRKAVLPALSREGKIRMVGTILHLDSLLMTWIESDSWRSALYKAHESFSDFSGLLWAERWTEEALRDVRQVFIDSGDPEGYSQEYLNDPSDLQNPFFREEDFIPMDEEDVRRPKSYYVGCDFALSDTKYSDFTVLTVGGYDAAGMLHIVDERRLRTSDTAVIIDELFSIFSRWKPDYYLFEGGVISNSIMPVFKVEMRKRNKYANVHTYTPIKDKRLRASSIQQRMRSGGVKYNADAAWYEDHVYELRRFPKGKRKDRVDAIAWLGRGIDEFVEAPTQDEQDDDAWQNEYDETIGNQQGFQYTGSELTGY